ncbi:hypothetical protein [Priestia megaterium]|uniref:hypothetical protein n=1 Tax=Priestia megaterium TaxID=1404 RepID=UPI0022B88D55|nr:hypothetical protein [Priestia megaterium]MCZ8493597.1 hypothetical protein [Priestia megaterium]
MRTCSIENCESKHDARGFCKRHYKSYMKYGDAAYVDTHNIKRGNYKKTNTNKLSEPGTCKVAQCSEKVVSKNLCSSHYNYLQRTGSLPTVLEEQFDKSACLAVGCKEEAKVKGYCNVHYKNLNRTGSPHIPKIVKMYGVDNCYDMHEARGLCHYHYNEWNKKVKKHEKFKSKKSGTLT